MLALAAPARADSNDYRFDNASWNGTSEFAALLAAAGLRPVMRAELDWGEIGPGDAVVILYPRVDLDPDALRAFVEEGGRLLLGDDFGSAAAALSAFGIERGEPPSAQSFEGRPHVLYALPAPHLLTTAVDSVVANHATSLRGGVGHAVLNFAPGQALAIDLPLGKGHLLALGDPSVLINNMLELAGNHTFARNLAGFLASRGRRVVLVTQHFAQYGDPRTARVPGGRQLADFNHFLFDLNGFIPGEPSVRLLAAILALVAMVLLFVALLERPRDDRLWALPFVATPRPNDASTLRQLVLEDLDHRMTTQNPSPTERSRLLALRTQIERDTRTGRHVARAARVLRRGVSTGPAHQLPPTRQPAAPPAEPRPRVARPPRGGGRP
jgi:hypothetical protein